MISLLRIDKLQTVSISGPFSSNKLQLSVDSAFAPIKSIPRSECTFHRNPIDTYDLFIFWIKIIYKNWLYIKWVNYYCFSDENQENEVF